MKKMSVKLTVYLEINAADDVEVSDIINEMTYSFDYPISTGYRGAVIDDTHIEDYELVDSK
jgi:hypothetical protein